MNPIDLKYFDYKSIDDLNQRARNILDELGGLENAINYYENYKTFLGIRNCGIKSDKELIQLCIYTINKERVIEKGYEEGISSYNISNLTDQSLEQIYRLILDKLQFCTARTQNAMYDEINRLCPTRGLDEKGLFIRRYFIEEYDYKRIKNIGKLSSKELVEIRKYLFDNYIKENPGLENTLPEHDALGILKSIEWKEYFDDDEIVDIVNGLIDFDNLNKLVFLTYSQTIRKKHLQIIYDYFLLDKNLTFQKIAKFAGITGEGVRQIVHKFSNVILPSTIHSICSQYKEITGIDLYENDLGFLYIKLSVIKTKIGSYTPNDDYVLAFNNALFSKTYHNFRNLVLQIDNAKDVYDQKSQNLYVNKDLVDKYCLQELLIFITPEILNFNISGFDYSLEILINRFYKETGRELPNSDFLAQLNNNLSKILIPQSEFNYIKYRKLRARSEFNNVINYVFDYLTNEITLKRTDEILLHLNHSNIFINKSLLLKILNSNSSQFIKIGKGYWTTIDKSDKSTVVYTGNYREIIIRKLEQLDKPIHISELLLIIGRDANDSSGRRSLESNLRQDEYKRFVAFNCSYYGLKSKKYDRRWYDIPKCNSLIINKFITMNVGKDREFIVQQLHNKYGWPVEHLNYIINLYN